VDTQEFFSLADWLQTASGATAEARERSAISRYYYSAFLETRDQLKTKRGFSFPPNKAHDAVVKALQYAPGDAEDLRAAGRILRDLKKLREIADYDLASASSPGNISEARRIANTVRALVGTDDLRRCFDEKNP
jgi:hypothetical protein